ncbi:MAG: mechanosensitive ion channel family protein [Saccharospirillaceae bacterium]|nr:mechanosensitive ion channel family protein [Pseudomonadales bacterium]NRB80035.1 mechanosensitive ion channel family protein [Saccharospirillaceae bacterium]
MWEQVVEYYNQNWMLTAKIFAWVTLTLITNFIVKRVLNQLEKQTLKTNNNWDDSLVGAARSPVRLLVWVFGFCIVLYSMEVDILTIKKVLVPSLISVFVWFIVRFLKQVEGVLQDPNRMAQPIDATTVSAIGKLLRASVIITGALIILQELDISITGVLAFGGVGGIAIGFAAKDLLANFFGGLMIYLDRPFKVGDWICSPDKNIEGTVEYIGWRLTRVRKFDKRPLYIPNSTFMNISVENPSRMTNRRIYEHVGVRYKDASKVKEIVSQIESYIRANDDIDQGQTIIVNLNHFGPSSIDIMVYAFTKTKVWTTYHTVRQVVLMDILDIIHKNGADVAFPTQTIELEKPDMSPV